MAKDTTSENAPFDLEKLRELIVLMEKHGLTEVSLRRGDERWQLCRGPREVMSMTPHASIAPAAPVAVPAQVQAAEAPGEPAKTSEGVTINSPTIGTFYAAPGPDDPPFVTVGAEVKPDTIVCTVEAMKVFNQIPAEISGVIAEVLVNNGDPVDVGQPLFRVSVS